MAYYKRSNGVYTIMTIIIIIVALFTYPAIGFSILGVAIFIWLVVSNWEYIKGKFIYAIMVAIIAIWAVSCARGITGW